MNLKLTPVSGFLAAAILFVAINILAGASLRQVRLDLTQNRLYTLSDGSRQLLRGLKDPIRLRMYYSGALANRYPQMRLYGERVRELLEEYAALSGGRIALEIVDPEPFSDDEDRAVQSGVQALPLDNSGRSFYFGLVGTNNVDDQQVIAYFTSEREPFLEYDLTRLVFQLSGPKKAVVGVLSDLPLEFGPGGIMAAMRGQSRPYAILNELRQVFDIKTLDAADLTVVDPAIGVLLVIHPRELTPQAVYAIDQFVLQGGRVMAFVDPYAESSAAAGEAPGRPPTGDPRSSLPELFNAWGISLKADQFVADLELAQRVQTGQSGPRQVVDYVAWLNIGPANVNRDDVVTADLGNINLASAGALRPIEGATTTFTPLVWSSAKSMLLAAEKLRGRPNPEALLAAFKPAGEQFALAARLSGPVKSAFPKGPPPAPADDKTKPPAAGEKPRLTPGPHLAESAKPVNLIVVADTDLIDDRFWLRSQEVLGQRFSVPIASNADLILNGVDNLSGSSDLISLRSRGRSQRPFLVVEGLRRDAEQKFLAQEKALQQKLEETQKKIADLQTKREGGAGAGALLSAEQRATMDGFRDELVATRRELRGVQRELNRDIEWLEMKVKFVNIGLIPIALAGIAGAAVLLRRRRRATA